MKEFILKHWNNKELPPGVRIITIITSIRWIGWGFAENLIPVLIYTFGHSFARSGLINSVYSIALILVVPIVGFAADRMRATSLIAIGLVIYLFVGLSYFLVGVTGMVIFIVIARFLNGISYSFDSIGRETYIMRYTPPAIAATAFGYFDTVANFWWIAASLAGIGLLAYFSIPSLLFLITPTALIALIMVLRFRKKEPQVASSGKKDSGKLSMIEIRSWSRVLKNLTIFNFFITAIGAIVAFFVPIEAYKAGASLGAIVMMGVVATIPTLLGWDFGKLFDIKGSKMFALGLLSFALLMFLLIFLRGYAWQVLTYFMVNMVLELLSVGSLELITTHTKPEHFGKVDGFIKSTEYIGAVVGPLAAGIIMDAYGFSTAYTVFAIILLLLAGMFYILQRKGYMERPVVLKDSMLEK